MLQNFVFKTTNEFSLEEQTQFLSLFARTFPRAISREEFHRKYLCTPLGYSHHGLMFVEGKLAGAYNLVPYAYNCFGARRLFGLSVDAMVAREHRGGPFSLAKMGALACAGAQRDGVCFVFGFPNDNAYRVTKHVLQWKDIGELDFYVLPVHIGSLRPSLAWANAFSRWCAGGFVHLPGWRSRRSPDFGVEKVRDERFERHRYNGEHEVIDLGEGEKCVFRTCLEQQQVRATYIIDVVPLTAACFARSVRAVFARTAKHTDLLLYVGRLPFRAAGLLKVPPEKRPRRIMMCGKILDRQCVDDAVLQITNWNLNISNFDVR